ncbi:MAG TPA: hypothetical protein VKR06_34820, partial [Ktedonosporobacter sp.]|nr:hypothetical protein [Ktedonosporobacter sp.]
TPPQANTPPAISSPPETRLPVSQDNLARRESEKPLPGRVPATPAPASAKVNVWKIGKRQVVAILAALALTLVLGAVWRGSIASIILLVGFEVFPLFFGALFGPLVGLVVGGIGSLLLIYTAYVAYELSRGYNFATTIGQSGYQLRYYWFIFLAYAILGFIAGLTILKTKGRYNRFSALAFTDGILALVTVIAVFVVVLIVDQSSSYRAGQDLLNGLLIFLPSLIVLPILLFVYDKIAYRKKRAPTEN